MPDYKNKETGEVKRFPRIRTHYHDDGTTTTINLDDKNIDMTQWDLYNETANYEAIRVTKAHGDGRGVR